MALPGICRGIHPGAGLSDSPDAVSKFLNSDRRNHGTAACVGGKAPPFQVPPPGEPGHRAVSHALSGHAAASVE